MLVLIMTSVTNQHHSDLWQHPVCWAKVVLRDSNTITNIVIIFIILIIFGSMLGKSSSTGFQLCHVTSAFVEHAIINIIIIIILFIITIITIIILFIILIILLPLVNVVVVEFNISTIFINTNSTVLLFYER